MNQDYTDLNDVDIVRLSLENKDNFVFIIRKYQDKLKRYIKRVTSFSDDCIDDILQEVFIKVYINLNGFDQDLIFSAWIYRITHNETISYYRKHKKHLEARVFLNDDDFENIASEIDIEKEKYQKDFNKILIESINELNERYQSVLILKFIEGQDYKNISDILQKPPGTIATWINRAKGQLKEVLIKKGHKEYE